MMEKLVRDGKVAVLVSPDFGAGWSTWNRGNYGNELIFDPVLAAYIDEGKIDEAKTYIAMRFPEVYDGGLDDVVVHWVPVGTAFRIHEYDGSERIEIKEDIDWIVA